MFGARVLAIVGLVAGLLIVGALSLELPVPVAMCSLLPPDCAAADLTRHNYFWGDSQAAPVFQLLFVGAPLVSLVGTTIFATGRRRLGFGLATASLVVVLWAHFVTFFFPLHPVVLGAVLGTAVALGRAIWSGSGQRRGHLTGR